MFEDFNVYPIKNWEAVPWIITKHYAHRVPNIMYAYGLYSGRNLVGVVTFGKPASPYVCQGLLGEKYANIVIELNRLVLMDGLDRNAASFFVSRALKMLPKPSCVVSYADSKMGHVGYVYQSCNFLYTGLDFKDRYIYIVDGEEVHERTLTARGVTSPVRWARENGVELIPAPKKHRYVFFCGSKRQRKEMSENLKYPPMPYPKGEMRRYDSGGSVLQQGLLF